MARFRHYTRYYKGRRVVIRGKGGLDTDVAALEKMVRADYEAIYRSNIAALEECAEQIQADATYLVPHDTGALEDSIDVHVSGSRRYPGIIAHASATNAGYDYALIQEETEPYDGLYTHEYERFAHYLGGAFALNISELFEELAGEELELTPELQHAKDYVEDKL